MSATQNALVLRHLRKEGPLTPLVALRKYGVMRLGARVWDLKRDGHKIVSDRVTDRRSRKHYASYRLAR